MKRIEELLLGLANGEVVEYVVVNECILTKPEYALTWNEYVFFLKTNPKTLFFRYLPGQKQKHYLLK